MSDGPTRYRYGARLRGLWLWPRGCWEYDLEAAKACALRTWPHATMVGVEPVPHAPGTRWICERIDDSRAIDWRLEATSAAAAAPAPRPQDSAPAPSSSAIDSDRMWWVNRDD